MADLIVLPWLVAVSSQVAIQPMFNGLGHGRVGQRLGACSVFVAMLRPSSIHSHALAWSQEKGIGRAPSGGYHLVLAHFNDVEEWPELVQPLTGLLHDIGFAAENG